MGAEVEGLILFFAWLDRFNLLAGGWRWHGAKSCLGPTEISPMEVWGGGPRISSGFHLFATDANADCFG